VVVVVGDGGWTNGGGWSSNTPVVTSSSSSSSSRTVATPVKVVGAGRRRRQRRERRRQCDDELRIAIPSFPYYIFWWCVREVFICLYMCMFYLSSLEQILSICVYVFWQNVSLKIKIKKRQNVILIAYRRKHKIRPQARILLNYRYSLQYAFTSHPPTIVCSLQMEKGTVSTIHASADGWMDG
jgi:hypothetical protein